MTMDLSPIIISLKTATLSIIITFFLGVAAAQFVFRLKSKTMKTILDGLFTLPLVLPPTVAGFFLLYIFGMRRPIGKFLIEYFAGLIFIKGMHVKLWDYSDEKFNIQGIICPKFTFFWYLLSAIYYFLIHPISFIQLNGLPEIFGFHSL